MMTTSPSSQEQPALIKRILHPSDFSEPSLVAFAHALKAALVARGKLALLHIAEAEEMDWTEFPGVRETLERWKLLPAGSGRSAVVRLGIDVVKIIGQGRSPVKGVLGFLEEHGTDLIVLASHHHGLDWLHHSVSEPVARKSGEMTLFVPAGTRGFVSFEDGSVSLRNILIPVADTPRPGPATAGAARLVKQLGCSSGAFTILHVGDAASMPMATTPSVPGWSWQKIQKSGDVIEAILDTGRQIAADLIVMSTDGRNGFLDVFRGSHSERVLRHSPCPLLAIPDTSHVATSMAQTNGAA